MRRRETGGGKTKVRTSLLSCILLSAVSSHLSCNAVSRHAHAGGCVFCARLKSVSSCRYGQGICQALKRPLSSSADKCSRSHFVEILASVASQWSSVICGCNSAFIRVYPQPSAFICGCNLCSSAVAITSPAPPAHRWEKRPRWRVGSARCADPGWDGC